MKLLKAKDKFVLSNFDRLSMSAPLILGSHRGLSSRLLRQSQYKFTAQATFRSVLALNLFFDMNSRVSESVSG